MGMWTFGLAVIFLYVAFVPGATITAMIDGAARALGAIGRKKRTATHEDGPFAEAVDSDEPPAELEADQLADEELELVPALALGPEERPRLPVPVPQITPLQVTPPEVTLAEILAAGGIDPMETDRQPAPAVTSTPPALNGSAVPCRGHQAAGRGTERRGSSRRSASCARRPSRARFSREPAQTADPNPGIPGPTRLPLLRRFRFAPGAIVPVGPRGRRPGCHNDLVFGRRSLRVPGRADCRRPLVAGEPVFHLVNERGGQASISRTCSAPPGSAGRQSAGAKASDRRNPRPLGTAAPLARQRFAADEERQRAQTFAPVQCSCGCGRRSAQRSYRSEV